MPEFKILTGDTLHRFRTRAIRRKKRKGLSKIWPKVWLPVQNKFSNTDSQSPEYLPSQTLETSALPSSSLQWYLGLEGQDNSRFCVEWCNGDLKVTDAINHSLLVGLPAEVPWFTARSIDASLIENRGFFHLRRQRMAKSARYWCAVPPDILPTHQHHILTFSGPLLEYINGEESQHKKSSWRWEISLVVDEGPIETRSLTIKYQVVSDGVDQLLLSDRLRLGLHLSADKNESIFGMGAQLTWLDLKGKVIPSWAQEPGIGRGIQPLTWFMERFFKAGGSDVQSSAPAPVYMTSGRQTHALNDYHFALFDFTHARYRSIEVWSTQTSLRVFGGADRPRDRLRSLSRLTGVMPPLPSWLDRGAVIGIQGGTEKVTQVFEKLKSAGVPVSAMWLQDWVGKRNTSVGEQLWWDWSLDHAHYPQWDQLCERLGQDSVKILGYINPYLVDVSSRKRSIEQGENLPATESLFSIARRQHYLVMDPKNPQRPLMIQNTSFKAAIVDLSSPEAFEWLKGVIKERMIKIGLVGWMADFGEALPVEAKLFGGNGEDLHNRFPELWAQLNREVIDELEGQTDQYLFFNRSGFLQTPRKSQLTWLGDQLTSWNKYDGIYSGLVGLLSSSFSGVTLVHSDTGGYICTDLPRSKLRIPLMSHARSPELLMRWAEMNAFTAILRTHEGNQPNRHHQIYDDKDMLEHFAKMSQLYTQLAPVRRTLMAQLSEGMPLVAHPWLYYPEDSHCLELQEQFMLGPDLMIAPVLRRGWRVVKLYLPEGSWGHWWSHHLIEGPCWISSPAPIGEPAAFYRLDSQCEQLAKDDLVMNG